MSDIDDAIKEMKRFPVLDDISIFGSKEDRRRERILHESDKQIGQIVARLKLKISKENLFMDNITREELR